jgi:tetraacyldisaccharide 4'-kinase
MNWLLFPLSYIYRVGSWIHQTLFDWGILKTRRIGFPLISVGNIAFGGTEKTPLVMQLLSFFLEKGLKPALITRGYKGGWERSGGILSDGKRIHGSWQEAGDEPFMVSRRFSQVGIYVGRKRLESCLRAEEDGFDVLILDDGFQHRRLQRDLDIVLFNPLEKAALREFTCSLRRADIILVKEGSGSSYRDKGRLQFAPANIFSYSIRNEGFYSSRENSPVPVEELKKRRILAVCAIARPKRFLSLLESCGIKPLLFLKFPDHHSYPLSTRKKIYKIFKKLEADTILTTEKDIFKLESLAKDQQVFLCFNRINLVLIGDFFPKLWSSMRLD